MEQPSASNLPPFPDSSNKPPPPAKSRYKSAPLQSPPLQSPATKIPPTQSPPYKVPYMLPSATRLCPPVVPVPVTVAFSAVTYRQPASRSAHKSQPWCVRGCWIWISPYNNNDRHEALDHCTSLHLHPAPPTAITLTFHPGLWR